MNVYRVTFFKYIQIIVSLDYLSGKQVCLPTNAKNLHSSPHNSFVSPIGSWYEGASANFEYLYKNSPNFQIETSGSFPNILSHISEVSQAL